MKVYLAGPMRGIPHFNFPTFYRAAKDLRAQGHEVFNPAERDEREHGKKVAASRTGDLAEAEARGFCLREALAEDMEWICLHAEAIALLPGRERSKGANAEKATAEALSLQVIYLEQNT